jgi:hypothetical protein
LEKEISRRTLVKLKLLRFFELDRHVLDTLFGEVYAGGIFGFADSEGLDSREYCVVKTNGFNFRQCLYSSCVIACLSRLRFAELDAQLVTHHEVLKSEERRFALFQKTRKIGIILDEAHKIKNPQVRR